MDKQLYIIKGTGLSLDGTVVSVSKREGDYAVVSPPNSKIELQTTMVHEKCLQPIDSNKKFHYRITISKSEFINGKWKDYDYETVNIEDALRDVSQNTIADFIETNLTPILRME